MERTEAQIRALIAIYTQSAVQPTLIAAEIDALVDMSRRRDKDKVNPDTRDEWTATTVIALNTERTPVTRNGYYYKATVAGTTGASEPTWPTTSGATVVDGTVTWTNTGASTWTPTWKIPAAIARGWELKAAKVATFIGFSSGTQKFNRQEMTQNFLAQANIWKGRAAEDVQLPSSNATNTLGLNTGHDECWDLDWNGGSPDRGWAIPGRQQWIDD